MNPAIGNHEVDESWRYIKKKCSICGLEYVDPAALANCLLDHEKENK